VPADFHPHPKIRRLLDLRHEMAIGAKPLDWAAGEALARAASRPKDCASASPGKTAQRGTFSHRHACCTTCTTGILTCRCVIWRPIRRRSKSSTARSPRPACLASEYGYSLDCPDGLVMWEAQFGDFCNAAQVIIDQFIVSAEISGTGSAGWCCYCRTDSKAKGPEHSSARWSGFCRWGEGQHSSRQSDDAGSVFIYCAASAAGVAESR